MIRFEMFNSVYHDFILLCSIILFVIMIACSHVLCIASLSHCLSLLRLWLQMHVYCDYFKFFALSFLFCPFL